MESPGLAALEQVLEELYALGPALPPSLEGGRTIPSGGRGGPAVADVLFGLGYLVALQERPEAAAALSAGAGPRALEVLRSVVREWLVVNSATLEQRGVASGYYERASEHLRRLGLGRKSPPARKE